MLLDLTGCEQESYNKILVAAVEDGYRVESLASCQNHWQNKENFNYFCILTVKLKAHTCSLETFFINSQ